MSNTVNRRFFLGAAAGVALASTARATWLANDKLVAGIMGTGGRGTQLARSFAQQKGVEIAYVCDVDAARREKAAAEVAKIAGNTPKAVEDYRDILNDKAVDLLVVATCNHWHAPAAIAACAHEKHVYVEKPCSYNPAEGEMLVEVARKHKRMVQMGNQRRSWDKVIEAIQQVREGAIGRAYLAQSWYTSNRESIGTGKAVDPPKGLNYDLWQGPAPRRPFRDNYLHYKWHWFWHWGNGELGNNGIHMIDLCRWGLGVDFPVHVTSSGGRYQFQDDQETPDTHTVSFDFDSRKTITWVGFSCSSLPPSTTHDVLFVGDKGSLSIQGTGYTVFDPKGKEVKKVKGTSSDADHIGNFLDGIRQGKSLNSEIEEAHKSTLLCHLGNIAQRTGRSLRTSPKDGRILDDTKAAALWTREYEKGFEPKV